MKIGYDLDGVLVDFKAGLINESRYMDDVHADFPDSPNDWVEYAPGGFMDIFNRVRDCPSFWLNIPARREALDHASFMWDVGVDRYVTARPVTARVSEEWLWDFGFPRAQVIVAEDKVPHMEGLDYFIEDNFDNWIQINTFTETKCLLLRTPHNELELNEWLVHQPGREFTDNNLVFDSLHDIEIYLRARKVWTDLFNE